MLRLCAISIDIIVAIVAGLSFKFLCVNMSHISIVPSAESFNAIAIETIIEWVSRSFIDI